MIFPYLWGIVWFRQAPITWILIFINALMMVFTYPDLLKLQNYMDQSFNDNYLIHQGHFFARFIEENPHSFDPLLLTLAERSIDGEQDKFHLLGQLAFRDEKFLLEGPQYSFDGDLVERDWWREKLNLFKELQASHPHFSLGINSSHLSYNNWISYQFMHSGPTHFFFNMIFLLIFGGFLELNFGGLLVLGIYLTSGFLGAALFLIVQGAGAVPLIGASAAISGLMSLVCFLNWKKGIKCFYWLFIPLKEYTGFVQIPAGIIFCLWLATDLAGMFDQSINMGGVAHVAHLGGELNGLLAAGLIYILSQIKTKTKWRPRLSFLSFHRSKSSPH